MADEVDRTVHEHPPVVRVIARVEQLDTRLDAYLGPGLGQLCELFVGEALEQADRAQVVDVHQIVAR